MPDSLLSSHVLQVNLQRQAREAERKLARQSFPPTRMLLVYGSPGADQAEVFALPESYVTRVPRVTSPRVFSVNIGNLPFFVGIAFDDYGIRFPENFPW